MLTSSVRAERSPGHPSGWLEQDRAPAQGPMPSGRNDSSANARAADVVAVDRPRKAGTLNRPAVSMAGTARRRTRSALGEPVRWLGVPEHRSDAEFG